MAGDAVVDLGIARPGRGEEPCPAGTGQRSRRGQAEPALAAPRPTERQDQRPGHATLTAMRQRPEDRRQTELDGRPEDVAVDLAAGVDQTERRRQAGAHPGRNGQRQRRPSRRRAPLAMTTATTVSPETTTSTPRTRLRNQPPKPTSRSSTGSQAGCRVRPLPGRSPGDQHGRHPRRGHGGGQGGRCEPARRRASRASASAATWAARTRTSATAPPEPIAGSLRAASAADAVARQQRVGGVGQPVEMQRAAQDGQGTPRRRSRPGSGQGRRGGRAGSPASTPMRAPTSPYAPAPVVSAETDRPGSAWSIDTAARISARPAPAPRRATGCSVVGGLVPPVTGWPPGCARALDRRRTPRGSSVRRATCAAARRRRSGRRP